MNRRTCLFLVLVLGALVMAILIPPIGHGRSIAEGEWHGPWFMGDFGPMWDHWRPGVHTDMRTNAEWYSYWVAWDVLAVELALIIATAVMLVVITRQRRRRPDGRWLVTSMLGSAGLIVLLSALAPPVNSLEISNRYFLPEADRTYPWQDGESVRAEEMKLNATTLCGAWHLTQFRGRRESPMPGGTAWSDATYRYSVAWLPLIALHLSVLLLGGVLAIWATRRGRRRATPG